MPNERLGDIFNESDIFNDQLSVALKAMQSAQYPFENDETIFNIKFGTEDDSGLGSNTAVDEELDGMYDAGSSQESSSAPISPSERDTSQQDGPASGDEIDLTDQTTEAMYAAELDITAQRQADLDAATQRQAELDAVYEELDDVYDAGSSQESFSAPISPPERDPSQQDDPASSDEIDLTAQTTAAMYAAELDIAAQRQAELDIAAQRQAELDIATQRQADLDAATQRQVELDAATQRQADLDAATHRKVELDAATQRQAGLDAAIQHEDELDAKEEDQTEQGTEYINTLRKLVTLKNQAHPVALDEPLDKLIEHVKKLKQEKKTPIADLTDALSCTYLRLTNQLDPTPYHDIALKMQGKTSIGLKLLGGLMLTLGITAAILGIVFFPALVGVSAAVTLSGVGATATAATGVATTSVLFGLGGAALFANSRQKGLSAAMSKLNHTLEEETFTFDTPSLSA